MDNLGNALKQETVFSRVLVTGAQGYLGEKIVNLLRCRGVQLILTGRRAAEDTLMCDLVSESSVRNLLNQVNPDLIIHCAAHVPKTINEYNNGDLVRKNLQMVENLISSYTGAFMYVSSMTVYGNGGSSPKHEAEAGNPTTEYGRSKWEGERLLQRSGLPSLAIRLPGLFGPPRTSGLVANLIEAIKVGTPPQLPKNPVLWAAMHVNDAAESIVQLAFTGWNGFVPVNVGYRDRYSISKLVAMASDIYGCKIRYDVKHPNFVFDLKRCEKFGAMPDRDLRSALVELGEAY